MLGLLLFLLIGPLIILYTVNLVSELFSNSWLLIFVVSFGILVYKLFNIM